MVHYKGKITLLFVSIFVWLLVGCAKKTKDQLLYDENMYSNQNFSDLFTDISSVDAFFENNQTDDSIQAQVSEFYQRRDFQFAWFNKTGMTDAVAIFYNKLQNYESDFADNSLNDSRLDTLYTSLEADEKGFMADTARVHHMELLLTTSFFIYSQKAYGGTTKNPKDLLWYIPRKKKNYQTLLDTLVSLTKGEKLQEPVNQYYLRLKVALRQYRNIEKQGGFGGEIMGNKVLSIGSSDSVLLTVKRHLTLTNDLKTNDNSLFFTEPLQTSIINYQRRMGLVENGTIDKPTRIELNRPVAYRIRQMMLNMERLRWVPVELEKDYLLINIPEFKIHVIENSKPIWEANVVVGKTAKRTSIFRGNISMIVFNPYWGIPTSIVKNEIVPKLQNNPNYLANNNIEVVDGYYRQRPGKNNALGQMKFMFPNNFHIYLHDTPAKGLFEASKRAFSHGCIRVENPKKLAVYLLRNTAWHIKKIDNILTTITETGVRINPTVPVYIFYFTAWIDNRGQLNFRNDVYGMDKRLAEVVFEQPNITQ